MSYPIRRKYFYGIITLVVLGALAMANAAFAQEKDEKLSPEVQAKLDKLNTFRDNL